MLTELGAYKLWGEDPERYWIFLRRFVPPIMRALCPSAGYGSDRLPATGGAVIAANHFSGIDPPLIGIYSARAIYYMTKIELLSLPVLGEVFRWGGAFAVRRGESDRDAIRVARWLVREGHVVGMFMEGTRQQLGHPGPVHPGAVMIAAQEGVPIVPVGVDTFGWTMKNRRRGAVVWGEPISLDGIPRTGKGYREGAALLEVELARLWRHAAEAVADGLPDGLSDGTPRSPAIPPARGSRVRGARPWPDELWAKQPLGLLYKGPGSYPPSL